MNNKKNCKIVQDLFPSYIEKLTDEETNVFIEEHLKECTDCKKVLENMQKEIKTNCKIDKKESNYMKKYSNKMKILRAILIVIFIILFASILRKIIIIYSLENKVKQYLDSNNYHIQATSYDGDSLHITDFYCKENNSLYISNGISDKYKVKKMVYDNGETRHAYMEEQKIAIIDGMFKINMKIPNNLHTENIIQLFKTAVTSTIKSTKCNGKDVYYIINLDYKESLSGEYEKLYIEKETGLIIRYSGPHSYSNGNGGIETIDTITDYKYEFNTIKNDVFIEPNLDEYEKTIL